MSCRRSLACSLVLSPQLDIFHFSVSQRYSTGPPKRSVPHRSGARRVVAVEADVEMAELAQEVVDGNGVDVNVLSGRVEDRGLFGPGGRLKKGRRRVRMGFGRSSCEDIEPAVWRPCVV